MVFGGVVTTIIALEHLTPTGGVLNGINHMYSVASDRFDMILSKDHPEYQNLPGIYVLIGGMWVANLYYWGFNQYIIQRALAAKSLKEAQKGIIFAASLKLIIPFIVVIPGIVAWVMYTQNIQDAQNALTVAGSELLNNDKAYPWLISTFVPTGLKGLVLAALSAAIISSLASMLNSTATIFTMYMYRSYINPNATQKNLVNTGRIASVVALLIDICIAPLLGSVPQMFIYIQEYTGLVSPGILAVFLCGLFWGKCTNKGAIYGILFSIPMALFLKYIAESMPFLDQMFYTCIFTICVIFMVSLTSNPSAEDPKAIPLSQDMFLTDKVYNIGAYAICTIVALIYALFW